MKNGPCEGAVSHRVIPAKAGIHRGQGAPAFAGVTPYLATTRAISSTLFE